MKKLTAGHPERKRGIYILSILSLTIMFSMDVFAMKIAFVDIQQALQSVKAGQKAKKQVEKEIEKRQKKLDEMRNNIVKLETEMKKQELVLTEEKKQKNRLEYTKKIQELQSVVAKNQQEMQQEEQKMLAPILEKMRELLEKISKEKEYDLILMKGAVLYANDQHDLTSTLIKTFDKEYKN